MGTRKGTHHKYEKWFHTSPHLLSIIADVHALVDAHRADNGLPPWDWTRENRKLRAKPKVKAKGATGV